MPPHVRRFFRDFTCVERLYPPPPPPPCRAGEGEGADSASTGRAGSPGQCHGRAEGKDTGQWGFSPSIVP